MGNKPGIALLLNNLGQLACLQKDYAKAQALHRQSLKLSQGIGSKQGMLQGIEGLARVASDQARFERAAQLWGAAEALRAVIGAVRETADILKYEKAWQKRE